MRTRYNLVRTTYYHEIMFYINALGVSYSCHYYEAYSWCYRKKNKICSLRLYSKDAYLLTMKMIFEIDKDDFAY